MVTCSRDMGVHLAALQLLNALPVPPNIEPLLRRTVPNLLGFLQLDNHNIQVRCPPCPAGTPPAPCPPSQPHPWCFLQLQVLRLLVTLSRMEELLPDILNCQVRPPVPHPVGFAGGFASSFPPWGCPQAWPLSPSISSTRFGPKS